MAANLGCKSLVAASALVGAFAWSCTPAFAKDWFPYPVQQWDPPFDMSSPRKNVELHAAAQGGQEVDDLRVLPAHEGCLLDGGGLRRGGGVQAAGREDAAGRGRRLHRAQEADLPDRGLRGRGRQCGGDRRHLRRRPEQSRLRDPQEEHPGHRRHQRHLLAGAVGQVPGVVRRDGREGGRGAGQAAPRGQPAGQGGLVPGPARSGLGGGGQHRLPGRDQGQRSAGRRDQVRRHRQGSAVQAGRRHAAGASRTSPTSSAPR